MGGGVDGHARHDAETFDYERHGSLMETLLASGSHRITRKNRGHGCEGADRQVEWALWTRNPTQLLAVCSKLESSPARPSKHSPINPQ